MRPTRVWHLNGVLAALLLLAGCAAAGPDHAATPAPGGPTGTPAPTTPPTTTPTAPGPPPATTVVVPPLGPGAFGPTAAAFERRVRDAGLAGGVLLVVRDGEVVHDQEVGNGRRDLSLAVASSAKWLTAATLLTFVDEGRVSLDDPVSRWVPAFADVAPPITLRQLLTHTSGVRDPGCIWDSSTVMAACADTLARTPFQFAAGEAFSYGNGGFHLLGRVIEVLGGADFASVFRSRIGDPVGMDATTWPGAGRNPSPAAGARTTVDDYARFLAMVLAGGTVGANRVLSSASVTELERNQVAGFDTSGDYSVGITRIPRYSFGAWPDIVRDDGSTVIVSGNGGRGFYPWVDLDTASYGIVGVQDDRGAEVAVPASQAVARLAWSVLRP